MKERKVLGYIGIGILAAAGAIISEVMTSMDIKRQVKKEVRKQVKKEA